MKGWLFLGGLLFSVVARADLGPEKLMLVGGGPFPPKTVETFCEWAGGKSKEANLLLIHWATERPIDRVTYKSKFHECIGHEESAPLAAEVPQKMGDLHLQIAKASAIFFPGGDQKNIMRVLNAHPDLVKLLRKRYEMGVPFGGTSAGTAIMSATMITGLGPHPDLPQDLTRIHPDEVAVAEGLGLLVHAVLDQHFLKGLRFTRLLNVLLQKKESLAIGIDEGASAMVEGNRRLTVLGGQALAFHYETDPKDGTYRVLETGDQFDLVEKKRLSP